MSREQFKPGWLKNVIYEAQMSMMTAHSPSWHIRHGFEVKLPISRKEAEDLYDIFNNRFAAWTGRTLKEFAR